jgi:hypothetical protein
MHVVLPGLVQITFMLKALTGLLSKPGPVPHLSGSDGGTSVENRPLLGF